jgi:tRNA(fMet)-specific endonuclease VapC
MKLALDSNRYTDFCRGDPFTIEILTRAERICVPLLVLGELRAGFAHGTRREANERTLAQFLGTAGVEVLCPDEQTTHFYASVYAGLRRRGTPIPTNDLWIAAVTLQHRLVLFDRDRDFDRVLELPRVGPGPRGGLPHLSGPTPTGRAQSPTTLLRPVRLAL